jgi:3-methyladenine DNA glycosylase AlkC
MNQLPAPPRKGYSKVSKVPPELLAQLNRGEAECVTLSETLALDFGQLFPSVVPEARSNPVHLIGGVVMRMSMAAELAQKTLGFAAAYDRFVAHRSDTVRGWAAFLVGKNDDLSLAQKLKMVRPLADDGNSGVREWAWLGVRVSIAEQIEDSLEILGPWAESPSANIRRFSSEATRPRGVWCSYIALLKEQPQLAEKLLKKLRSDDSVYVQNSVANWLNDAGKARPLWVKQLVETWQRESATKETLRICQRATRNL